MSKPHIHLSALSAFGSFTDCILFCQKGLESLGYATSTANGSVLHHTINIVFCSQMLTWKQISAATDRVIVYNWEPAASDIGRFPPTYIRQMQRMHVWDYNQKNVRALKSAGVQDIHYVPMGYTAEMRRIDGLVIQDIDVLFYGFINERRRRAIDRIRAKGLHVVTSDDVGYMSDEVRDGYIARAKVVLNMHFFEQAHVFEIARVGYLLANRKAVVAEVSEYTDIEDDIHSVIASGSLDELPQLCWDLVHDDARRHELEQRAFEVFSRRDAADIMRTAMNRYFEQAAATPSLIGNQVGFCTPLPDTLRLKSGFFWRYDNCNLDFNPDFAPDLPLRIDQPIDFDAPLESWRFGRVVLQPAMFKKIVAGDVFNQVVDVHQTLTNCLLLLADGGEVELDVPLDMSYRAWSEIDTRHVFNEQTWQRIIDNWWQYGWLTHRFEIVHAAFAINGEHGMPLLAQNGNDWGAAIKTPRAMDSMVLVLRKRALNAEELKQLPQTRFMD